MKTEKNIILDLMLLGLTIAMMILFKVTFYGANADDAQRKTDPVSIKVNRDLKQLGEFKTSAQTMSPGMSQADATPRIMEVLVHLHKGEFYSALALCNQSVTIDTTDARFYYLRAGIYDKLNKKLQAIKDYSHALKLNPQFCQAYLDRGFLCVKEKKILIAFFDFINAIKINPLKAISFILVHSIRINP